MVSFKQMTIGSAIGGFILLIVLANVLKETFPSLYSALLNLSTTSGLGLTGIIGGSVIGTLVAAAFIYAVFRVVGMKLD